MNPSHLNSHVRTPLSTSVANLIRVLAVCSAVAVIAPTFNTSAEEPVQRQAVITRDIARSPIGLPVRQVDQPPAKPKGEVRSATEAVRVGLEYLVQHQQPDGGWGQGGGWRQNPNAQGGRVEKPDAEDPSDLGNTCVSLVALLRAGHTPVAGNYKENAAKAFDFVCRFIEKADDESLFVTPVRDTQLQVKIGTYVDTFLAGWVLSEVKGHLLDEAAEKRRTAALDKVVRKIERNQKEDGSFNGNAGWAAVLSQGLCSKALNSAARSGAKVSEKALEKDQRQNLAGLDVDKLTFSAPSPAAEPSSAGVSLYREASKLGGLSENWQSSQIRKQKAEQVLADEKAPAPAKAKAKTDLEKIASDDKAAQAAVQAVGGKLSDQRFVAGFGNNGGEEFLSYMNVTDGLRARGGKEWTEWKPKMEGTVCEAQNADGSWAGHHCITGRTFCTGAALLTLLSGDNAAVKVAEADSKSPTPETTEKPVEPVIAKAPIAPKAGETDK